MYIARRVGLFAFSVFVASVLVFVVVSILPGDAAAVKLGTSATPEALAQTRAELGTDRPLVVQYVDWAAGAITGDLGNSFQNNQPVWPDIRSRLALTVPLALFGMTLAVLVAFPAGVFAASRHGTFTDTAISGASQVGLAIPAFWAGLMLVTYLVINRTWPPGFDIPNWFPANGFPGWSDSVGRSVLALVLPACALAFVQGAILTRYVRSAVLQTLREDYLRTARMKGLTKMQALWRHGLRNAALPVITIIGLQFGALLAGTVVIESVFVLPGLGTRLLKAIDQRDLPVIEGIAFVMVVMILLVNLIVDLTYRLIDPRVAES